MFVILYQHCLRSLALAALSVGLLFRPHAVLIAAVLPISHCVLASSASPIALTAQDGESTPTLMLRPHPCRHCVCVLARILSWKGGVWENKVDRNNIPPHVIEVKKQCCCYVGRHLWPSCPPLFQILFLPSREHRGKGNEAFCLPELKTVSVSRGVSGRQEERRGWDEALDHARKEGRREMARRNEQTCSGSIACRISLVSQGYRWAQLLHYPPSCITTCSLPAFSMQIGSYSPPFVFVLPLSLSRR